MSINGDNPEEIGDGAESVLEAPEEHLEKLGQDFMAAMQLVEQGDNAGGEKALREILKVEPRLAEPRMELARLRLLDEDLESAEVEARNAVALLDAGGQWNLDIPEDVMSGLAHGLLGEVLRQKASSDAVLDGPPETFQATLREAQLQFQVASDKDPENEHARYHAFHLGLQLEDDESTDD